MRKAAYFRTRSAAFNIRELMVVVAIISIFALILSTHRRETLIKRMRISCVGRLKQMGLAYRIFATDHGDKYPMSLSTNLGGTAEWNNSPGQLFRHFQIVSNELSVPKVILCPSDYNSRLEATNFQSDYESKANMAISYFLGLDSDETKPQMILFGDRDIVDPRFGLPGKVSSIVNLGTNHNQQVGASWEGRIHRDGGNVALGDGSVQQSTTFRLREQLRNTDDTTNRLGFP